MFSSYLLTNEADEIEQLAAILACVLSLCANNPDDLQGISISHWNLFEDKWVTIFSVSAEFLLAPANFIHEFGKPIWGEIFGLPFRSFPLKFTTISNIIKLKNDGKAWPN